MAIKELKTRKIRFEDHGTAYNEKIEETVYKKEHTDVFIIIETYDKDEHTIIKYAIAE